MSITQRSRVLLLTITTALMMVLAACGGNGDDGGEDGGETDNGDVTFSPEGLDQSAALAEGTATIRHPEDWYFGQVTPNQFKFVRQEADLNLLPDQLSGDQFVVTVDLLPVSASGVGVQDPVGGMSDYFEQYTAAVGIQVDEPESFTINGKPALIASGSSVSGALTQDAIVLVVLDETAYGVMVLLTAEGQGADFQDTLRNMAGTFEYTPVPPQPGAAQPDLTAEPASDATPEATSES